MSAGSVDVGDVSLNSQAESGGSLYTGAHMFNFAQPVKDKTELYVMGSIALVVALLYFKKKGR